MKTIADIANELNVSKTSIYNILKKNESDLKEHLHKKQGKSFLDEHAEKFLINYYAAEALETLKDIDIDYNENNANSASLNDFNADSSDIENNSNSLNLVSILQKQLEIKDEQLERKDAQIKDLTESIVNISLAFSDRDKAKQQELFLQAMDKKEMFESTTEPPTDKIIEPPPKENFFKRIFKKK